MNPTPIQVFFTAETADGEKLSGSIFTISTEKFRDTMDQLLDKFPNEELHNICLSAQVS